MANIKEIVIPDIGSSGAVTVIEIAVKPGDKIKADQTILTLESEKATMEVPSSGAGIVDSILVKVGDKVSTGKAVLKLRTEAELDNKGTVAAKPNEAKTTSSAYAQKTVVVPDIGSANKVNVIEVLVKLGDAVNKEQTLITLEGDKATMEIPSPYAGKISSIKINVNDKVSAGDTILVMETQEQTPESTTQEKIKTDTSTQLSFQPSTLPANAPIDTQVSNSTDIYAGPAVRRIAREFGLTLSDITGTGYKGRIQKEDVQNYVKKFMSQAKQSGGGNNIGLPSPPTVDFAKFGEIKTKPLTKIKKLTGVNLHRNWLIVPHVTQFEEADITELEVFRKSQQQLIEKQGIKLTPLVFIMKAVVATLKVFPTFNASLDPSGEQLIMKKYFHIGVAVDTPDGLVVPVIRDVDKKGFIELAKELADISAKARNKNLMPVDMQGSCFTISSLGGIGGTAFTPIVNLPDVAILGVSKAAIKPVYQKDTFVPRLMLPLSLSYDHRVIDGAEGARFIVQLAKYLTDIRQLLM